MNARMRPIKIALALGGALLVGAQLGCSTNPATGRSQLNLMSRSQEIALGEEAKSQLTGEYGGSIGDATIHNYFSGIGRDLSTQTEADFETLPWEFTLLDSEVLNAFALPGGKVFVSRGLAEKMDSEAELAFVMGHEVGHVTARHVNERISRQMVVAGAATAVAIGAQVSDNDVIKIGVPAVVGVGAGAYLLKFGRDQESEADELGMRYMERAGYNPYGAYEAMGILAAAAGDGQRQPEFLSTHPYPETRLKQIQQRLQKEYPNSLQDKNTRTFPGRYQSNMLSRLAMLPPAPDAGTALAIGPASGVGDLGEVAGGVDPLGQVVGGDAPVHVGAESDAAPVARELADVIDVGRGLVDGRAVVVRLGVEPGADEVADEVEADDASAARDLADGVVGQVAEPVGVGLAIEQRAAVGVAGHDGRVGEGEQLVGRSLGEVREIVDDAQLVHRGDEGAAEAETAPSRMELSVMAAGWSGPRHSLRGACMSRPFSARILMAHGLKRYTARRGGALAGCLIVLGVLVVLVIVGVVIVAMNWKGWLAGTIKSAAEQAIQQTDLPESEKGEVLAEITALADGFKNGDITFEEFMRIGEDIANGPLIPAAVVGGFESMYLEPSGLSDEEKAAGGLAMSRVAQGVSDDKIEADPLKAIFNPIQTASTTGAGVHINHPEFNLHLKEPKACTDEELRQVIANATAAADGAGVANERVMFDVSDEIRAAVERATGKAPALESGGEEGGGEGP
eukprot:g5961.t1